MMETDRDFAAQLSGHRLTTAEVLYYMPDHPSLVQSFLWQTQDLATRYPRLIRFLDFWRAEIDAVIHTVRIAHRGLIGPAEWSRADIELRLN
ncbi:Usg family protein [Maricaulis sp.]|uniref:usg protein n=1 Tax=Maricaulis sp. TaxID=1486257 RepID=UPI002622B101|nr:Usg family protein [Maricaulis sp.]